MLVLTLASRNLLGTKRDYVILCRERIWWKPQPSSKPVQTTAKKSSKFTKTITHVDNKCVDLINCHEGSAILPAQGWAVVGQASPLGIYMPTHVLRTIK